MPLMDNPFASTQLSMSQSLFKCRSLPIHPIAQFLLTRQDKLVFTGEQLLVAFKH
jgi:hypothetical protein